MWHLWHKSPHDNLLTSGGILFIVRPPKIKWFQIFSFTAKNKSRYGAYPNVGLPIQNISLHPCAVKWQQSRLLLLLAVWTLKKISPSLGIRWIQNWAGVTSDFREIVSAVLLFQDKWFNIFTSSFDYCLRLVSVCRTPQNAEQWGCGQQIKTFFSLSKIESYKQIAP